MSVSKEQVRRDRINLGRLVKKLEEVLSDDYWQHVDSPEREEAWVRIQGIAQKIKYCRQLCLNLDYYEEIDPQTSASTTSKRKYVDNVQETLDRLDGIVDTLNKSLALEPDPPSTYLSLVPLPTTAHEIPVVELQMMESEAPLSSNAGMSPGYISSTLAPADPAQHLLPSLLPPIPSVPPRAQFSSQPRETSFLLSASLQTHEELSSELSRMASQLKRNAQHFSDSLDKDKTLIHSASEALEANLTTMTKEGTRLRNHTIRNSSTTWMVFGVLVAVLIAWIFMVFIIRFT